MSTPFWKKPFTEMSREEWESLCDGCARCCLNKLEDEDNGDLYLTNVACRLLDLESCRCSAYEQRTVLEPECIHVTPDNAGALRWMPPTCAYRLLAEGHELPDWHPLVSGNPESVHEAGISVRHFAIREDELPEGAELEDFIIGPF